MRKVEKFWYQIDSLQDFLTQKSLVIGCLGRDVYLTLLKYSAEKIEAQPRPKPRTIEGNPYL